MIYVNNCVILVLLVTKMTCLTGRNLNDDNITKSFSEMDQIDNVTSSTEVLSITPITFEIPYENIKILCNATGAPTSHFSLIFTQGASGGLSSPAVVNFIDGFAELKQVITFRGRSSLDLRTKMLKTVIEHHPSSRSMGSRVSIEAAKDIRNVTALVLVSFPLKSTKNESRHHLLLEINENVDVLLVIGNRDGHCDLQDITLMIKKMKNKVWLIVVKDANHFMEIKKPRRATRPVGQMVGRVVARWIEQRNETLTNCEIHWDEKIKDVVVSPWSDTPMFTYHRRQAKLSHTN